MNMLETIAGWELDTVHLLMASRKERDIEMSLKRYISEDDYVCLERHLVDRDISLYVEHRLCEDRSLAKWGKSDGFRQEIEAALMRGAHGMYVRPDIYPAKANSNVGFDGLYASWTV
jgi:hypothetical protein